jgi:hypothetical protein
MMYLLDPEKSAPSSPTAEAAKADLPGRPTPRRTQPQFRRSLLMLLIALG